jgi:hypothetical protein
MTVSCNIVPCNLVEVDQRFVGVYCLHNQDTDHGCSKNLRNIGQLLQDYMLQYPRRLSFHLPGGTEGNHEKLSLDNVLEYKAGVLVT